MFFAEGYRRDVYRASKKRLGILKFFLRSRHPGNMAKGKAQSIAIDWSLLNLVAFEEPPGEKSGEKRFLKFT